MRYRRLALALCSLGLVAGCGVGQPAIRGNAPTDRTIAATVAYSQIGKDPAQQQAIATRVNTLRAAHIAAIKARPIKGDTLRITVGALESYDDLALQFRAASAARRAQLADQADQITARAVGELAQVKDPWGDPDQDLRNRLDLLEREYRSGTFSWRDYNEARVTAILRAYGASVTLRLDSLEVVYREGGIGWQEYNKHRRDILSHSYGTPLAARLELLAKIYREGGMAWSEYNQARIAMIQQAYEESVETRLDLLEDVYREGGMAWTAYNQARLDLIARAYGERLAKRLDLLLEVYQEGGVNWTNYNQTRVNMILEARYEPLDARLAALEAVYNEGGISWSNYQQYRKQLISQG